MPFDFQEVWEARERIRGYVRKTPLEESYYLGTGLGGRFPKTGRRYFFKLECLQRAKSFKIRGALNKMLTLTPGEVRRGVAAVSSGNHGSSVAYAASILGIKAPKIIVPSTTPQSKRDKIRYFGGDVLLMGDNYDGAHVQGLAYIREHGLTLIDSCDEDPKVYGGQGTVGLENMAQNPDIDTIICPMGGGSLATGVATAAKHARPGVRVFGVQTEASPAFVASYRDGVMYEEYPTIGETICDATVGGVGRLAYELDRDLLDGILVEPEETVRRAVAFMARGEKFLCEGAGCLAVAAVMNHAEQIGGRNVALVVSGGNIDGDALARVLNEFPDA